MIQRHILRRLASHKTLRYGEMKPAHIEGNQFSYHLKTLIRLGFVAHKDRGYNLSTKGVHYSTQVNFEHFSVRIQPKIATLIVCKNNAGKYLIYTRNKQPFIGMDGFPYGKIHLGERIAVAAKRELQEKIGISARLAHKGMMYLAVTDHAGEMIAHTLFHVFLGTTDKNGASTESPLGRIRWLSEKELLAQNVMPGVPEALKMAKSTSRCLAFEEYEFQEG